VRGLSSLVSQEALDAEEASGNPSIGHLLFLTNAYK